MDWGRKWLVDFSAGKTQLVSLDRPNNAGAVDVKMMGLFLRKNHLSKYWSFLSLLNWIWFLTLSLLLKLPSKEIGVLIGSIKFLFFLRLLCISFKSTIRPYMEYYCNVWASAPSFYSELLDKLQKRIFRLLDLHLLPVLNPWLIVKMWPA